MKEVPINVYRSRKHAQQIKLRHYLRERTKEFKLDIRDRPFSIILTFDQD